MRLRLPIAAAAAATLLAAAAVTATAQAQQKIPDRRAVTEAAQTGIHKIKHVIVILQENRTFDSYFGTFPGADGIPPGVCVPDPGNGGCVKPFVDHRDSNTAGPHGDQAFTADVDGGKMDGFIGQAELKCKINNNCGPKVMGYHVRSDIPNYWKYAKNFVLNEHMFEPVHSWSLPSHMYEVSAWSAKCQNNNPASCTGTDEPANRNANNPTPFSWTDLTWLLHKNGVNWGYYLDHGQAPINPGGVPTIWNVLPGFVDVHADGQTGNIQPLTNFFSQASTGTLPSVSWISPDPKDSEHPPALVSTGQAYVTRIINAVMNSSDWKSSAIFLAWDDWGGFYDHVNPLSHQPDSLGYGIRVPAMVISPFAKRGYIDPHFYSFDSYLRFIEDDFLGGARLDPATDGRPDPRPDVRESQAGNLIADFNFGRPARPPLILNPCPATTLVPKPKPACAGSVPLHVNTWGDT
jgi:phospholipase C